MITTAPPVITTHPNNNGPITVSEGSDVGLTCKATGQGTLSYQWRKVSGALPKNSISNGGQTLALHNLASDDSGEYYCEVGNGRNKVTSKKVKVTVKSQLLATYIRTYMLYIIFIIYHTQRYPESLIILVMYN